MIAVLVAPVLGGSGSLADGLLNLTNYLGNIILPVLAGLCLVLAVRAYMTRKDGQHFVVGAIACLLASSFVRLAGVFASHSNSPDAYYYALVSMTDWLGNVILPTIAALEFVRAVLSYSGSFDRALRGQGWVRHAVIGFMCLTVSGMLRLLTHFVIAAS